MEKNVRYLMLLLCLFLFPMKAFALEGALEGTNKETEKVEFENILNNENQKDVEDLVKIENPDTVLLEEDVLEAPVGEKIAPAENTTEKTAADTVVVETTRKNVENNESNDKNQPENTIKELSEIKLINVNADLVGGQPFTFGASSGEAEKYSIVREEWIYNSENFRFSSSDATYNASQPQNYIESPLPDECYDYSAIIQIAEGYGLPENVLTDYAIMNSVINGESYEAWVDQFDPETNRAHIYFDFQAQAKNTEATIVDSLEFNNVSADIKVGEEPTYGAEVITSHFTLVGEYWYYYVEEYDGEEFHYYSYSNASDPLFVYGEFFKEFAAGQDYTYWVVVDAEAGYRWANEAGAYYSQKFDAVINGEPIVGKGYGYQQEDGTFRYEICVLNKIPTEEQTEEPTSSSEPVTTATSYNTYVEESTYEEPTTTLLVEQEEKKDDNKLEVKKDTKKNEQEKEEKKDNSNVGLIVFLVILIGIAIAIPITVYKKKQ